MQVLDVGAGNGIVAAEIKKQLGARLGGLVGTDILSEACDAAMRDRPGLYDKYVVADLLDENQRQKFGKNPFDVMIICAALGPGWGDMPVEALLGALELVAKGGLVATTVNERWLGAEDKTAWGQFTALLNGRGSGAWSQLRELQRKRYQHRKDVKGEWIWYIGLVFEKV